MKKFHYICYSFLVTNLLILLITPTTFAQLSVTQGTALGKTPIQLIQDVLIGSGITVSNGTFNGSAANITSDMIGSFTTTGAATTQLGFTGGIILTSGTAAYAIGPNNNAGNYSNQMGTGSDDDLQLLIQGYSVNDKAVLEFDFVPISDTVRFRYVFGSEEFDEYCNSNFNDVFGFFISGPGIAGPFSNGAVNIALMPNNPNNYVTIDNVCSAGSTWSWLNTGGQYFQYDRLTKVYTAQIILQACQQYHIKLAVGDAGDQIFDSGVFLEENSFMSNGLSFSTSYTSNIDTVAVEGCNNAIITFHLGQPATETIVIHYTIGGTAIEDIDYPAVPDSLVIYPGDTLVYFEIDPISDGINETPETVEIIYVNTACGGLDTITIIIKDYPPLSTVMDPAYVHSCNGVPAYIGVIVYGGFYNDGHPMTYEWSDYAGNTPYVTVNPTTPSMYYVTVNDGCGYHTIDSVMVSISNLTSQITQVDSVTCYGYTDGSATVTGYTGLEPYSYSWSDGTNIFGTNSSMGNLGAGQYFVTVTDDIGCTATNFVILEQPPHVILTLNSLDQTCTGYCNGTISTLLSDNYSPPVSYAWSNTSQTSANVINLCPGGYTCTVTYSAHNCFVVESASISTQTLINSEIISNPYPPEGYVPFEVQFTYFDDISGPGSITYHWDFGDPSSPNNISTLQNPPPFIYNDMGDYMVILVVSSGPPNFCEDADTLLVHALIPSEIKIPNVFTPNGDSYNDVFQIESQGIQSLTISIFNRWGKKIFNNNFIDFSVEMEKKDVWNGTSNSDGVCADGTYFYIIEAVGYDKKEYNFNGTITLLK
ncbi:MAG: choice-of-anchor L domain-containing protein [Bacteroidales bacterium]|jgi:gliding motility-associated-like protein|nr:choice-of-anchor L domain-containing protein [Bacteroidales bacterium]MDD4214085.1 choice-of-anchor L domain-containing protein [Bacteroidales bacterium]